MPLTLQEAQLVSWKVFRKINSMKEVPRKRGFDLSGIVTDLLEEAGKVASTVKGLEGFRNQVEPNAKETLAKELSDMLYAIFVLAEHYGLSLEDTFLENVNEYLLSFVT